METNGSDLPAILAGARPDGDLTTAARVVPRAVWVCGSAASGKSEIGRSAILPLGFELIDTDLVFEELLREHGLSAEIAAPTAEEKARARRGAAATRLAQRLVKEQGETIEPPRLIELLDEATEEGDLEPQAARELIAAMRARLGEEAVSSEAFQKAVWPRMKDWQDPRDYLEDKPHPTRDHLLVVAREITRRALVEGRRKRRNLLIVETGGQTGKTLNARKSLESEGYETFLIWVWLRSLEDACRRNRARGLAGGRCLAAEILERSFTVAEKAREKLVEAFQPFVLMIDNAEDGTGPLGDRIREVHAAIDRWMMAG